MARSRNIKPAFFTNDILADCTPLARLLFIGLWTIADKEGRLEDRVKKIKAEVLPYDDCNCDDLLNSLCHKGFIIRYSISNNDYIQIVNFTKHQHPHIKETASTIPAPDFHQTSTVLALDKNDTNTMLTPNIDIDVDINNNTNQSVDIAPDKHSASTIPAPDKHSASSPSYLLPLTLTPIPHPSPNQKKDDDLNFKKVWTKEYSQTAPHDDFNTVHKYITDRLPNLKRQSAHEINTWLEVVPSEDILRHVDFCLAHSSSPPVSFKYFTPSIMSEATLKKELAEQTERMRAKYAE